MLPPPPPPRTKVRVRKEMKMENAGSTVLYTNLLLSLPSLTSI